MATKHVQLPQLIAGHRGNFYLRQYENQGALATVINGKTVTSTLRNNPLC